MMGWYGAGMGWAGWVFMGLFWIALIALIVWLVVILIPTSARGNPSGPPQGPAEGESPLDILDRRFARGEIDLETYQAQRAALIQARGGRP